VHHVFNYFYNLFVKAGIFAGHYNCKGDKKLGTMIRLLLTILIFGTGVVVVMAQRPGFPGGGNRNLLQSMPAGAAPAHSKIR
jgi:hypothetical protein